MCIRPKQVSIEAAPLDEIILEEMQRRLNYQFEEIETANSKAGLLLAYYAALTIVLVTSLGPLGEVDSVNHCRAVASLWLVCVTGLLFIAGIATSLVSIWNRTVYHPVPTEKEVVEALLGKGRTDALLQLLTQYSICIERNAPLLKRKSTFFNTSLVLAQLFSLAGVAVLLLVAR